MTILNDLWNALFKKKETKNPPAEQAGPRIDPLADLSDAFDLANTKAERLKKNAESLGQALGILN